MLRKIRFANLSTVRFVRSTMASLNSDAFPSLSRSSSSSGGSPSAEDYQLPGMLSAISVNSKT